MTDLVQNKTKLPQGYSVYSQALLEKIIKTTELKPLEKLFYLRLLHLSKTQAVDHGAREVILGLRQWAKYLNINSTTIFNIQQTLETKGFIKIFRQKIRNLQYSNIVSPLLPYNISQQILTSEEIANLKYDIKILEYLEQEKHLIYISNNQLDTIICHQTLSARQKLIYFGLYHSCYIAKLKNEDFLVDYAILQAKHNCSKSVISKAMQALEKANLIKRKELRYINVNRHELSKWQITMDIDYHSQNINN